LVGGYLDKLFGKLFIRFFHMGMIITIGIYCFNELGYEAMCSRFIDYSCTQWAKLP